MRGVLEASPVGGPGTNVVGTDRVVVATDDTERTTRTLGDGLGRGSAPPDGSPRRAQRVILRGLQGGPMRQANFGYIVRKKSCYHPEKVAIVERTTREEYTYGELERRSNGAG